VNKYFYKQFTDQSDKAHQWAVMNPSGTLCIAWCLNENVAKKLTQEMNDNESVRINPKELPDDLDLTTNNGDWRGDADFRSGWNSCLNHVKDILIRKIMEN
jgi:hypothetical protein